MKAKEGLVVESLCEGGCLIVDEAAGKSHALQAEAAAVWTCVRDGIDDPQAIAERTALAPGTVDRALAELADCELVEATSGASRREILSKAAAIAGAAAGLKMIESIATPTPAAAQSFSDSSGPV